MEGNTLAYYKISPTSHYISGKFLLTNAEAKTSTKSFRQERKIWQNSKVKGPTALTKLFSKLKI
jgi:hypothetical protein